MSAKGAKDALDRYFARQMKELEREQGPKRKNAKPEFEVRKAVMAWLRANGFSCNVIEAKAVYSYEAGRYTQGQTAPGVADLFGCTPDGLGCFIELKAPDRRSTLRPGQREFLISKIQLGCFAVVVDSVECLSLAWAEFTHRRKMDPQLAKTFLLRHLPHESTERGEGLFD